MARLEAVPADRGGCRTPISAGGVTRPARLAMVWTVEHGLPGLGYLERDGRVHSLVVLNWTCSRQTHR